MQGRVDKSEWVRGRELIGGVGGVMTEEGERCEEEKESGGVRGSSCSEQQVVKVTTGSSEHRMCS